METVFKRIPATGLIEDRLKYTRKKGKIAIPKKSKQQVSSQIFGNFKSKQIKK